MKIGALLKYYESGYNRYGDHKYVTVCLENMPMQNFSLSKPEKILEFVREIKVLHVHDNTGEKDTHQVPYTGIIDWEDFGRALQDINFDGVLSMETAPQADLADDEFEKRSREIAAIARKVVEEERKGA